jgi:hypothetical protein
MDPRIDSDLDNRAAVGTKPDFLEWFSGQVIPGWSLKLLFLNIMCYDLVYVSERYFSNAYYWAFPFRERVDTVRICGCSFCEVFRTNSVYCLSLLPFANI